MNIENELLTTYTTAISDIPAEHHHLVEIAVQAAIHFTRVTTLRDMPDVPELTLGHAFTMSEILLDEFFHENYRKNHSGDIGAASQPFTPPVQDNPPPARQ